MWVGITWNYVCNIYINAMYKYCLIEQVFENTFYELYVSSAKLVVCNGEICIQLKYIISYSSLHSFD